MQAAGHGHLNVVPMAPGVRLPEGIKRLDIDLAFVEVTEQVFLAALGSPHHPLKGTWAGNGGGRWWGE
jgi:hypothetical protein